jgi:hypothetical protein
MVNMDPLNVAAHNVKACKKVSMTLNVEREVPWRVIPKGSREMRWVSIQGIYFCEFSTVSQLNNEPVKSLLINVSIARGSGRLISQLISQSFG